MNASFRSALMAIFVMVPVTVGSSAFADQAGQPTTAEIERLIRRGVDLRRQGKDQQALAFFEKAYDAVATSRTAAQLALCEMQLGYWLSAESHLSEALGGGTDPWIEKHRKILQESLEHTRKQIGEVLVTGTPPTAEVSINGRVSPGHLPLGPVRVAAGTTKVGVRAAGYLEKSVSVTVAGGSQVRVTVDLERDPALRALSAPPSSPEARSAVVSENTDKSGGWPASKIIGASMVGAGSLAVLSGAGLLLFDKRESCDAPVPGSMCLERSQTRLPGWGLIGAGIGLGVVGGILLYRNADSRVALTISPTSTTLWGRF